jgi:tetratricopeptide (TPR) repeat protein/DNA-binding transcriptional ArsR family regulator
MKRDSFVARFTPSMLSAETLEAIFVKREKLAARLVDLIRESALTDNKHYVLLVGPRGIGKTHLVSLLYHRVKSDEQVADRLVVAWLREEEWGVSSFLDLLLRILRALHEEENDKDLAAECEKLRTVSAEQAELDAENLLKRTVGKRTLLLIAENLDDIFNGLGEDGQERLRGYIQNNPFFTILATSQSLFSGVSLRTSPFYAFFETQHLEEFVFEDAVSLIANIAELEGNKELGSMVQTPRGRARVRAVHHLAGGNPRVYVIFSGFLTTDSLDGLVGPALQTLDDLTPYYQARMSHLTSQQRKIVDFLCQRRHALPVGEIASGNFLTPQTTSSQLGRLRELGYVRCHETGRESYYELREPLMRLCNEVKNQHTGTVRLFVDFLRIWFSPSELTHRFAGLGPEAQAERAYLAQAMMASNEEAHTPVLAACLRDYWRFVQGGDFASALGAADELTEIGGYASDWMKRAYCLEKLGRIEESRESRDKAMTLEPETAEGWCDHGIMLNGCGLFEKALRSFDRAVELNPDSTAAWRGRAVALDSLKRYEESLECDERTLKLEPADPLNWRNRGAALERLKRYEEALGSYDKSSQLDPTDALTWRYRAFSLEKLGRYEEALACHDKSLELNSNDPLGWRFRTLPLDQLGRYAEALQSCEKSLDLNRGDALTWRAHAIALGRLNRYQHAVESCDKSLQLDATDASTWRCKALYMERLGDYEQAVLCYEKSLELNSDDPLTWQAQALPLWELGRYEEAERSCEKARELGANSASFWLVQAIGLYRVGRLAESLDSLEACLTLAPESARAWSNRGVALAALARYDEALKSFDKSRELDPEGWAFHDSSNRAVVLMLSGRWEEGLTDLDESVSRLGREGGSDGVGEVAIVRNMLVRTRDEGTWRKHIPVWVELFGKHGVLSALGHGLVRSIGTLQITWIADEAAQAWRDVWQEIVGGYEEMQLPLRLLNTAVEYRSTKDARALLRLPAEERDLLRPLLGK